MVGATFWRITGAAALCAALVLHPDRGIAAAAADPAEQAATELQQRGLVKITGRVWGLPLEAQLRARLRRLPALRERIVTAQKDLDERIIRNQQAWQQAAPAIDALQSQLARFSASDPQRPALADQLRRLSAEAVEPAALAGRDAVRTPLASLAQDRCTLILDLVWIRQAASAVPERYRQLADDEQVARLIRQVDAKCRLGPARNYANDVRKLADYDLLAFAPHVPVYLHAGRLRVTALICDSACLTFSWSEKSDAVSFLPTSALASAGITVPAGAPHQTLRIDGRRVECRELILPSLRLGSCHAKSVAVWVLPPEAEDLGAQLTPLALSPGRGKVEIEKLRMVLE